MIPQRDHRSILVVGVGTELRGDDEAGLLVIRRLKALGLPDEVRCVECTNDGLDLIDAWRGCDAVILVDAVSAGLAPGTIVSVDVTEQSAPLSMIDSTTHHLGLAHTIELARALNSLPPVLLVYGIQGEQFQHGQGLSPAVAGALDQIVNTIAGDLRQWSEETDAGSGDETMSPLFESNNERVH